MRRRHYRCKLTVRTFRTQQRESLLYQLLFGLADVEGAKSLEGNEIYSGRGAPRTTVMSHDNGVIDCYDCYMESLALSKSQLQEQRQSGRSAAFMPVLLVGLA